MNRRADRRYPTLCAELYRLALERDDAGFGPQRGFRWERRIASGLAERGFLATAVAGGVEIHGVLPASGLRHQIDATIGCRDAEVIGEWKAYRGPVPKNQVLRFKAVTDDLYDALSVRPPKRPIYRLFGVAGDASDPLRHYAARYGITLVERSRWPAPVLADEQLHWPAGIGPSQIDRRRLAWLSRPLQSVYPRLPDDSVVLPKRLPAFAVEALLHIQDLWSDRLWELLDQRIDETDPYAARTAA